MSKENKPDIRQLLAMVLGAELKDQCEALDSLLKKMNDELEKSGLAGKSGGEITVPINPAEGNAILFAMNLITKMLNDITERLLPKTPEPAPTPAPVEPEDPLTAKLREEFAKLPPDWSVN